jgi:large subunit ribosomal protein L18e
MKNRSLSDTIESLKQASEEDGKPIWRALAEDLDKSKRSRVAVNLSQIDRHKKQNDVVAVPGKVLAAGSLTKPLRIAAYAFSEGALEKIKQAKSDAMTLNELVESDIQPSQIKIIK